MAISPFGYIFPQFYFFFFVHVVFSHFCSFMGVCGFGVLGLRSNLGFLGLGFKVDLVLGLSGRAFWDFWVGAI